MRIGFETTVDAYDGEAARPVLARVWVLGQGRVIGAGGPGRWRGLRRAR